MPLENAPIVAHLIRGGAVEGIHHGLGVITGSDGQVLDAVGDPATPIFPRSSNKPMQALAMLRSGLKLTSDQLAMACASHSGEDFHLRLVHQMLETFGLAEADLQNTPDLPLGTVARDAWLADGHGPTSLTQNCSGKHAAMLATCVTAGWDKATYRAVEHPLQKATTEVIAELAGEAITSISVDGCGAPAHQYALQGLARAFGAFAGAQGGELAEIAQAMREHPHLVGGTDREDTDLMRLAPGVIAKLGAEGVLAVGLPDGRGVAAKCVDGNPRATRVLTAALLRRAGGIPEAALKKLSEVPVLGHGQPVGEVRAVF